MTAAIGRVHPDVAMGAVLLVWLASLAVGWTIRSATETATRQVVQQGLSVAAPASWIVEEPSGDLLLVTRNPLRPGQAYSVTRLPEGAGTLDEAARENRVRAAAQREGYLAGGISRVEVGGRPADRTVSTFIGRDATGRPSVLDAVDYVLLSGTTALVITLVSPPELFDQELPAFDRFARSVTLGQS